MTANTTPGTATAALGSAKSQDGLHILRYERPLAHPIDRVWSALVDPRQVAVWLGLPNAEPTDGGEYSLLWQNTDDEGRSAELRGTVTELDPPRKLEISIGFWGEPGADDADSQLASGGLLRWELEERPGGCVLRFTNALPDGAFGPPPADRNGVLSGWHIHLDLLEDVLAGSRTRWTWEQDDEVARWEAAHARYLAGQ